LVGGFPLQRLLFEPESDHVGFVADKAALEQVFSEYFGFPCQSFQRLLHTHHHPSSGAGTIGHIDKSVEGNNLGQRNLKQKLQGFKYKIGLL
jgi:hypothetical protein